MRPCLARAIGALALSAALAAWPVAAATAAAYDHEDPTGDVQTYANGAEHGSTDPSNTNTDITRVKVAHNKGAAVITMETAGALPTNWYDLQVSVHTPTKAYDAVRARIPGTVFPGANYNGLLDDHFHRLRCAGFSVTVDRVHPSVRTAIPRKCIGAPRWIRVTVMLSTQEGTSGDYHFDDGFVRGVGGRHLAMSPKLFAAPG